MIQLENNEANLILETLMKALVAIGDSGVHFSCQKKWKNSEEMRYLLQMKTEGRTVEGQLEESFEKIKEAYAVLEPKLKESNS